MGLPPSEAGLGTCVLRVQTPSEMDTLMPTWGLGLCLTLLVPEPRSPLRTVGQIHCLLCLWGRPG